VSTALLLSVAYGANLGGIGTKIGTATNSIFCGVVHDVLGFDLGFVRFMLIAAPFVLVALPLAWLVLRRLGASDGPVGGEGREVLRRELSSMGRLGRHERLVAAVFLVAAALWVGGELVRPKVTPGLSRLLGLAATGKHYEAAVAMLAGLSLLALRGLSLRSLARMPWSSLLLLGGSFAMAQAIEGSGLGAWVGARLAGLAALPLPLALVAVAAGTIALSAVASNTATINVALSVLPRSMPLFVAAMLGASCDFMLPAGTPPNAIVFGTGRVRLVTMIRVGALLDVGAALLIAVYVYVYARFVTP
jgi:sodium-dependent dicarboxylate transporter 2/3/5